MFTSEDRSSSAGSQVGGRLGIIGCGNISRQYVNSLVRLPNLTLVAVADVFEAAAEKLAAEAGEKLGATVAVRTPEELIAADDIDVVLNLTIPAAHAEVSVAVLEAGKHVYQEKPFAASAEEAQQMLAAAERTGGRIGMAPDTVLGTGIQTARKLVDDGAIGTPLAATAFMMSPGHERWHPNPAFYYAPGGGPLLDMGVYYLQALLTILGPVEAVTAMASRSRDERVVPPEGPRAGETLPVAVDTYTTAILRHAPRDGVSAISTLTTSFDTTASRLHDIEVYGTTGAVAVPDPNGFDGAVALSQGAGGAFEPVEPNAGWVDAGRGYGLADLVRAASTGQPHRQSAEAGWHVFEVMDAISRSAHEGRWVMINSAPERPAAVDFDTRPGDQNA